MWLYITLLIILVFAVFLFCKLTVSFSYSHVESENKTELVIKYLFIKKKIPIEKKEKTEKNEKKEQKDLPSKGLKDYYNLYKLLKDDVFKLLDYLMKKAVVFQEINIKTDFGCKDAATTGILTGTLNGVFYNIIAFFHNHFTLKTWEIEVNPDFENEKFSAHFDCIVKLKCVHIIIIALKGIKILFKLKKALKKGRENDGTSNSRTNGNSNE